MANVSATYVFTCFASGLSVDRLSTLSVLVHEITEQHVSFTPHTNHYFSILTCYLYLINF